MSWRLPDGYGVRDNLHFDGLAQKPSCEHKIPEYVVMDLTADGVVDLVVVESPCGDDDVGADRWLVYEGGPNGFANTATDWSLPSGYGRRDALPFDEPAANADCDNDIPEFAVSTLDAAGGVSLVLLQSPCGDDDTGRDAWLVYASSCSLSASGAGGRLSRPPGTGVGTRQAGRSPAPKAPIRARAGGASAGGEG